MEDLEQYGPGGHHPVQIDDTFCEERYHIVHKLGAGGYATVYLAKDSHNDRFVALKFLTARSSIEANELAIHTHLLRESSAVDLAGSHVLPLMDYFFINGPNGRHLILVMPVLGPSVADIIMPPTPRRVHPVVSQCLGLQLATAVRKIHKCGVIIGDLSTSNVLFCLRGLSRWNVAEVYSHYGPPEPLSFQDQGDAMDGPSSEHVPRHIYDSMFWDLIDTSNLEPSIALTDLGEAMLQNNSSLRTRGIKFGYQAPELFFGGARTAASDIWALACCLYEIRTSEPLFTSRTGSRDEVWASIRVALGPFPEEWIEKGAESDDADYIMPAYPKGRRASVDSYFDRIAVPKPQSSGMKDGQESVGDDQSVAGLDGGSEDKDKPAEDDGEIFARRVTKLKPWLREQRQHEANDGRKESSGSTHEKTPELNSNGPQDLPSSTLDAETEHKDFVDLLTGMLKMRPEQRLTMEEVLAHGWFKRGYGEVSYGDDDWLQVLGHIGSTYMSDSIVTGTQASSASVRDC